MPVDPSLGFNEWEFSQMKICFTFQVPFISLQSYLVIHPYIKDLVEVNVRSEKFCNVPKAKSECFFSLCLILTVLLFPQLV